MFDPATGSWKNVCRGAHKGNKNIFQKLNLAYNQNSRGWCDLRCPIKSFYVWSTADRLVLHLACLSDSLKSFNATKGSAKVIFHFSGMLSIFECLFLKLPYKSHIVESEFFFIIKSIRQVEVLWKFQKAQKMLWMHTGSIQETLKRAVRNCMMQVCAVTTTHLQPLATTPARAWFQKQSQNWRIKHGGRSLLRPVKADQSE